jgi:predicted nucleic acid-binding protein
LPVTISRKSGDSDIDEIQANKKNESAYFIFKTLDVQPLLDNLIANGFWLRQELYAEILQLAGE